MHPTVPPTISVRREDGGTEESEGDSIENGNEIGRSTEAAQPQDDEAATGGDSVERGLELSPLAGRHGDTAIEED